MLFRSDDGIHAEGINVLHGLLVKKHEVFVIAPEEEKSGAGSSITTKRQHIPNKIKENFIAINGTPVDCVHLGLHQLCPFKPDLLLSGINFGANMAEDLLYSGTVGAAMEAREFSIPSIADIIEPTASKVASLLPGETTVSPSKKTKPLFDIFRKNLPKLQNDIITWRGLYSNNNFNTYEIINNIYKHNNNKIIGELTLLSTSFNKNKALEIIARNKQFTHV